MPNKMHDNTENKKSKNKVSEKVSGMQLKIDYKTINY